MWNTTIILLLASQTQQGPPVVQIEKVCAVDDYAFFCSEDKQGAFSGSNSLIQERMGQRALNDFISWYVIPIQIEKSLFR